MSLLEDAIQASGCFGLLYDEAHDLCKKCEAWYLCDQVTQSVIDSQPEDPPKWTRVLPEDYVLPDLSGLSDEEIEERLEKYDADLSRFADYKTPRVRHVYMMATLKYFLARDAADEVRTSC